MKALIFGAVYLLMAPIFLIGLVLVATVGGQTDADLAAAAQVCSMAQAEGTVDQADSTTTGAVIGFVHDTESGIWTFGTYALDEDQHANALYMTTTAVQTGGTQAALVIITAALDESGLNTNPGSLGGAYGVLQQTPPWWGTQAQVMNVAYATNGFLTHLTAVSGWQTMPPWQAAQAVQRSGAGAATNGEGNYGKKVPEAEAIVSAVLGYPVGDNAGCAGVGQFALNTQYDHVGTYDATDLAARMSQYVAANGTSDLDPFYHGEPGPTWKGKCQAFVAFLSSPSDHHRGSGFATAAIGWSALTAEGAAHPIDGPDGYQPPIGAWLYYANNNDDPDGHVAVYMGNNMVASTDVFGLGTANVGPESDLTNGTWNETYLGWAVPYGAPLPAAS